MFPVQAEVVDTGGRTTYTPCSDVIVRGPELASNGPSTTSHGESEFGDTDVTLSTRRPRYWKTRFPGRDRRPVPDHFVLRLRRQHIAARHDLGSRPPHVCRARQCTRRQIRDRRRRSHPARNVLGSATAERHGGARHDRCQRAGRRGQRSSIRADEWRLREGAGEKLIPRPRQPCTRVDGPAAISPGTSTAMARSRPTRERRDARPRRIPDGTACRRRQGPHDRRTRALLGIPTISRRSQPAQRSAPFVQVTGPTRSADDRDRSGRPSTRRDSVGRNVDGSGSRSPRD